MSEKKLDETQPVRSPYDTEPNIVVNDYGATRDSAVVVEEAGRTVLLTEDETIVIEKGPTVDVVPSNRPRKVYKGMWGPAEIVTAGLALLAALACLLLYLFVVVPSNREVERNRAEKERLERELVSAREKYGSITDTETQVAKLVASIDDFESRYLPVADTGRTALYQRLNSLIAGYGLVNTTGPDYAPLETLDRAQGVQSDEERGRSKFRSLFPGVYVTTTVEGPYANLRRFIRDIETGDEFVVISAVELEPSDTEQKSAAAASGPQPAAPGGFTEPIDPTGAAGPRSIQPGPAQPQPDPLRGRTHGAVVRLRMEMAAYFRRPLIVQPTAPATGQ